MGLRQPRLETPAQVFELLNEFFASLTAAAFRHDGTVFNMSGDSLMVGFGVPIAQDDGGVRALRAAREIKAGNLRVRPILLTSVTTILGLLPMAIGLGAGSELRRPMALTVIFGLLSSTVLTLIIIPLIYYLVDGLRDRFLSGEFFGEFYRFC